MSTPDRTRHQGSCFCGAVRVEVTGKPFAYSLTGDVAILDCPPPPGGPKGDGFRYRLTLASPAPAQEKTHD